MTGSKQRDKRGLENAIGAPLLAIYGAGTILGAGIFVLVGEVAGIAGYWTPFSFAIAAIVAAVNGMVYAELSTRAPSAGGPSDYVGKAFGGRWPAIAIGWMIVTTGVVSGATIVTGFSGYLAVFYPFPEWLSRTLLLLVLGAVAAAGVKESAWFMAITTSLGLLGLAFVLWAGFFSGVGDPTVVFIGELPPLSDSAVLFGVLSASFLSFYAYIGFEDMVHMAEEVKRPSRAMPVAIFIALSVAAVLYVAVSTAALNVLPPDALHASKAPLADVVAAAGLSKHMVAGPSLAIILNGALAQIIMASRVIFSLRAHDGAPAALCRVHRRTKTPLRATVLVTAICLALALFVPLKTLASITSFIMLLIFVASSSALIILEQRQPEAPFDTPRFLPWLALMLSLGLLIASFFMPGGG